MKGRKPEPTARKLLKGTRKDRINENEPEVVGNFPTCPSLLEKDGKAEWLRIKKATKACPYITTLDRGVLTGYCTAWEMFLKCHAMVAKAGPFIVTKKGNIIQNPALSGMNKAMEQILKFGAALGFSPSERSRMVAPKSKKPKKGGLQELLD